MRSQALYSLAILLILDICILTLHASAQEPPVASREGTAEALSHLERRLDELEQENRAIRAENAQLLSEFQNSSSENEQAWLPAALTYTPGEGSTISLLNDTSRLQIGVNLSALATFSTSRPFSSSLPLFLFPADPTGRDTNTFDLHARQSSIGARLSGPEVFGLTPGAEILTLFFNDNITDDNYGMLVYFGYGELKNDEMRFAAGLQRDIFNPVGPSVLPMSLLYGSGNAGSYRGQIRFERFVHFNDSSQLTSQLGLSNPISTLVRNSVKDPLVEDNGWPNIEGRMALGVGEIEELMGGRKQRRVEFGISGVVGQIRISKPIPGPGTPGPDRIVDDIWAVGCDLQWAVTDRLGIKGELYVGQTLGDYNAGVLQNFNSETFGPIRTSGAWAEVYYYLNPQLHIHCGYGIDDPINEDLAAGQIASNQTFFSTLLWDLSKTVQFGLEVDYRTTNYVEPLKDANGLLVMTQFLWRF
jgi:hypothetical protein